jgi:pyruvate formate lyase activating enzyme
LLQADFCAALLKALKAQGIHTAVDTCGMVAKGALDKVLPYTDVFLYDVKAVTAATHQRCTGYFNGQILDNLVYLEERGAAVEIRIPFVPEWNDEEIEGIGEFLAKRKCVKKVRLLAYHNLAGSKYEALGLKNTLPQRIPTQNEVTMYENILKKHGLNVVE